MRKRKIAYVVKMTAKGLILLLPLLIALFSYIQPNSNLMQLIGDFENDFNNFAYTVPLNSWYISFLEDVFGFEQVIGGVNSVTTIILVFYPLYVIWIELFDLVLHFLLFIPNLIHSFMKED